MQFIQCPLLNSVICELIISCHLNNYFQSNSEWEGSGQEATAEQQSAIPPVQLVETDTGAAESQAVTTVLAQQAGNDFEVTSQATEITEPASVQAIVAEAPPVEDDVQTFTTSSPTPSPTPKPTSDPTDQVNQQAAGTQAPPETTASKFSCIIVWYHCIYVFSRRVFLLCCTLT